MIAKSPRSGENNVLIVDFNASKNFSVAIPTISWQQVGDIIMHERWSGLRFIKRKGTWHYEKNPICKISILKEW